MLFKLAMWLVVRLSFGEKKALVLTILESVLRSRTSSLDKEFAEAVMAMIVQSKGNAVTAYLVKE